MGSFLRREAREVEVFQVFGKSRAVLVLAMLCVASMAWAQPPAAAAPDPQDPQAALRAQIDQLRQQLDALQKKVEALEAAGAQPPAAAQPPAGAPPVTPPGAPPAGAPPAGAPPAGAPPAGVEVPPGAAGAGGPAGELPSYGNSSDLS